MTLPYLILERKRAGRALRSEEIAEVVRGAVDGSWSEGQLGAFLMAAALRGLDPAETAALTRSMLESGERWELAREVPGLCDKHSTGGVGDKVSLVLAPLLASCGVPVAMLVGRALGHTGGTADKLESLRGLDLELDRERCLRLLQGCGMAIGVATDAVVPADRRLYALRSATATIDSLPLITASILSKKLATGAAAVVFDVKVGNGAFLPERERAAELARMLTGTLAALGTPAAALLTDMSQPLGRWAGHAAEVAEALGCLAGEGPADLLEVSFALAEEVALCAGRPLSRPELERAIADGSARERFERWAAHQGAVPGWAADPRMALAPVEHAIRAPRAGWLAAVDVRRLGLLLAEAGAGRPRTGAEIDPGVALEVRARLGQPVEAGEDLARVYVRRPEEGLAARFAECFTISGAPAPAPELVVERIGGSADRVSRPGGPPPL